METTIAGSGETYSVPSKGDIIKMQDPQDYIEIHLTDGSTVIIMGDGLIHRYE